MGYISAEGGYILDYLKNNNPLKHSVTATDPNCYSRYFLMARKAISKYYMSRLSSDFK